MSLKSDLLTCAIQHPDEIRKLLADPGVIRQLEFAGIELRFYELHAPDIGAKKAHGLGVTLCGRPRGMRNKIVTCKRCLTKIQKTEQ